MKIITIEIPDGYDDAMTIAASGKTMARQNVLTLDVKLTGHDSETLVIRPHERPEWRKPETCWVPVTERLPEIGKPVITFDGDRFAIERYVDRFFCDGEEIEGEGEWWIDGYDGDEEDAVGLRDGTAIAWMPLPEPPEEV